MRSTVRTFLLLPMLLLLTNPCQMPLRADESTDKVEQARFFELHIRPLLAEHCYQCHGEEKQKGGLRLDSHADLLAGGESGPALVPGKPDDSPLIQAVRYETFEMPPDERLPDAAVKLLEEWIRQGAYWPDSSATTVRRPDRGFTEEDRNWWAVQPIQNVSVPHVESSWCRNEIDRFLLSVMSKENIAPAEEADRVTLIRRLSFDLTGLPPTEAQIREFQNDVRPDAYEHLVDSFLASPHYGERWARHWLDVVRYADSDGYRIDHYRPDAWRYRDYVIRALNSDKPYDRFVQEQLAGDEMFPDNPDALIATGYLRHWIYEYNNRDARTQWDIILNDVTDTTGDVFLGIGMQCARCHDHKFDPILQRDYFRLRAFFEPIHPKDRTVIASTAEQQSVSEQENVWRDATAEIRAKIDAIEAPWRDKARLDAIEKFPADIQHLLRSNYDQLSPADKQLYNLAWRQVDYEYDGLDTRIKGDEKERLLALRRELAQFDSLKPAALPTALVVSDIGAEAPPTIIPKKKTLVNPGVPSLLDSGDMPITGPQNGTTTGRRSALALWLTSPSNPLTARVIVNRVWQAHFGRGLAPNASDFGTLGGPPSHPELLDWLAAQLVRDGWSLKSLHRRIVTSAAYRQRSEHPQHASFQNIDPQNRYYWHAPVRRLDAEQIRDAILASTGQLRDEQEGPGVQGDVPRRSIYLRVMRNERDSLLDVFDLPLFFASTSSRDTTTSPIQSLLLFNSQMMQNHAGTLADLLLREHSDTSTLLNTLWIRVYGRAITEAERTDAEQFLQEEQELIRQERTQPDSSRLPVARLPHRDGQAIAISPSEQPLVLATSPVTDREFTEFTIEAAFQIRSIYDTGAVRTIAACWNGKSDAVGWSFGVTGKGSRRKPQTLVLQIFGNDASGKRQEAALFSDQHIVLNHPWSAAVSVRLATQETPGSATFTLKDLANEDAPVQTITLSHQITGPFKLAHPMTVGMRSESKDTQFDGLIDDVRWSSTSLKQDELLIAKESLRQDTLAFWKFETVPGVLQDSSPSERHLNLQSDAIRALSPQQAALTDLCHLLLNSNEFLYVR